MGDADCVGTNGINNDRFRSLELYRQHPVSSDVVTFD